MYKIGKNRALMIANKMFENLIYDISLSEGNSMTLLETASTLSGKTPENAKIKDVILVTNLKYGFDYIFEKVKKDDFYFDKDTLCRVNRIVAMNDNFDNLGDFRHYNIKITGAKHTGVAVPDLKHSFFETLNKYCDDKRPCVKEIDLFLDLCKNQYFGDGNKRTAQLMMCGLLVSDGYAPFAINFKEMEFSKALVDFYDDESKRYIILDKMLNKQKEMIKSFLTKEELKDFEKQEIQYFVENISVDDANKMIIDTMKKCQNDDIIVTKDFISSIKHILKIQDILSNTNDNYTKTDDLYSCIDNFLERKNTKDMNAVLNYLEKTDFPDEYLTHFKEKFETNKKDTQYIKNRKDNIYDRNN